MANTYTQIYLHVIFAVKDRESLIKPEVENTLHAYLASALRHRGHHPIAINGMADHIHLLIGLNPGEALSSLVQSLKIESSKWMKGEGKCRMFAWQSGYAAFSYSASMKPKVEAYIARQKEHHAHHDFNAEMAEFLRLSGLEYDENYRLRAVSYESPGPKL